MIELYVNVPSSEERESIEVYCTKMSKRNNSILYKLEKYLDKKLLSDDELIEIRNTVLNVSAEIAKLPHMIVGEDNEGL